NSFGELTLENWKTLSVPIPAAYLAVADFNADGHDDLLMSSSFWVPGDVQLILGDGMGNFSPSTAIHLGGRPRAMTVGDFNGDGLLDFAVVNTADNYVAVFLNRCPAPNADMRIAGIEVSQTIQDLANSVPLIAGKRTFVRVH